MEELKLLLKHNGFSIENEGKKILFESCPLCKEVTYSALNERAFMCEACIESTIPIEEFFKKLNIPYDPSPTDFVELFEANADQAFDPKFTKGWSTGISAIDSVLDGGLHPAHLYVLAADTGMGKSVLSANLIVNQIKQGRKCSFFDLENGKFAEFKRFVSIYGGKSTKYFENPENKDEGLKISQNLKGMLFYRDHIKLAQFIENKESLEMAEAISDLIKLDVANGSDFIVIDPLEEFEPETTDYNKIAKVIRLFKNLAQELKIPILVIHHLKKVTEASQKSFSNLSDAAAAPQTYRIPVITDLLGSKKITNIATDALVMVRQLHDPNPVYQGRILFRSLKQREGQNSDAFLTMNLDTLKITGLATEYYPGQGILES